ncbi:putative heme-binding protein, SOUL family [Bradyrhizobium sp. ORS 285]|uniref:SOUL family heme-binding protein n=1 Tax=Bradyrhizobium sp. ORS 285 TaxID=115808 RepID=UPI0002407ECE|nr:heme-binding protein [Bradyrhizobium sp. ORS 285]CCD87975.1 putative heme-binding protein, SOUL family [Bradyrhizobium sp. ORS 285]SMX56905.1 putative heme-binding protein, SOUL family [Bradyrhizobium sp. ORS 285]
MLIGLTGLVVLVVAGAAIAAGPLMSRVEHPKYDVVSRDGDYEIRAYAPMIIAQAEVQGARRPAIEEGFRIIGGYIFGANQAKAKIAMTAPVQQQASAATAPADGVASDRWSVSFVMPSNWTLDTLPPPADDRIKLTPMPAQRMVALTFSGSYSDGILADKTRELRDYAQRKGLAVSGAPLLAFYNPPWTLPMLRRNEVMLACSC